MGHSTGHTQPASTHWADINAARIIREKGEKDRYTCASGITPSGTVHVGNFREIISVDLVVRALRDLGKNVRFLYSWDDYDVFRKVPGNVPDPQGWQQYLRQPITSVPDPAGTEASYARANEAELEGQLERVGIEPEYIYQAGQYQASRYAPGMRTALERREEIRDALNRFRTTPLPQDWWPLSVFSRFTNRDTTTILGWDGEWAVTYRCDETSQEDTVDLRETGCAKLPWRIDWPMRWSVEGVDFEPAGKDHHSEGGSFDTARLVSKEIYGFDPPVTFQYDFISIKGRGGKMSSSSGEVISLRDVLQVYQPEVVRYLFAGTRPNSEFAISFDLDVIKIYEDYDRCERIYFGQDQVNEKRAEKERRIYELSQVQSVPRELPGQVPFRHLCNLLLIHDGLLEAALGAMPGYEGFDEELRRRARQRAQCAWEWITTFAPEEFRFSVVDPHRDQAIDLPSAERTAVAGLRNLVAERLDILDEKGVQDEIYQIARDAGLEPKDFFAVLYRILIRKEKGPRLGGFLKTLGQRRLLDILEFYGPG
ncbi:lysine--tRNA ligase [Alkalispirochaeta americana]|nr:lysine--tRNA ligase [Alkalispirochaeta americana]